MVLRRLCSDDDYIDDGAWNKQKEPVMNSSFWKKIRGMERAALYGSSSRQRENAARQLVEMLVSNGQFEHLESLERDDRESGAVRSYVEKNKIRINQASQDAALVQGHTPLMLIKLIPRARYPENDGRDTEPQQFNAAEVSALLDKWIAAQINLGNWKALWLLFKALEQAKNAKAESGEELEAGPQPLPAASSCRPAWIVSPECPDWMAALANNLSHEYSAELVSKLRNGAIGKAVFSALRIPFQSKPFSGNDIQRLDSLTEFLQDQLIDSTGKARELAGCPKAEDAKNRKREIALADCSIEAFDFLSAEYVNAKQGEEKARAHLRLNSAAQKILMRDRSKTPEANCLGPLMRVALNKSVDMPLRVQAGRVIVSSIVAEHRIYYMHGLDELRKHEDCPAQVREFCERALKKEGTWAAIETGSQAGALVARLRRAAMATKAYGEGKSFRNKVQIARWTFRYY